MSSSPPVEVPPDGPMALVLTHEGFEASTRSLATRSLVDAAVLTAVTAVAAGTLYTFMGLFRALAQGTSVDRGYWCLLVAPGLLGWAWQTYGTSLFRAALGVRRIVCTADYLELGSRRVPLRRITHCEPTIDGLLLRTLDGDRSVKLAAPDRDQIEWLACAVQTAAEQARRTPLPPPPPEALSRLRRS